MAKSGKYKIKMAALNHRKLLLLRNNLLKLLLLRRRQKRGTKYKNRFWIRRIYAERQQKGEFHLLVKELSMFDHEYFFQCFCISPGLSDELLSWVGPHIKKKNNKHTRTDRSKRKVVCLPTLFVTGDAVIQLVTESALQLLEE